METERTASFLNCMKTIRRKDSLDTNFELEHEDMSRFFISGNGTALSHVLE